MAKSPILVPIVTTSSLVRKTPNGIFCIGKSLSVGTSSQDFLVGSLAVIGIIVVSLFVYKSSIKYIVIWHFNKRFSYFCPQINKKLSNATRRTNF
ncbi:hypothetical protein D9M72_371390 [compost metagenome]